MPRANRYIVPGFAYHLTHRCHNREFLFKFAVDRQRYRIRLREALLESNVALLTYNITHNHVHLLAFAEDTTAVATMMQQAAGEFARDYNRRKQRSGAFWEGRYHVTMVDSGRYLWECLQYVELNMVRCGAVSHPSQWEWSGCRELIGLRKRNRLLDIERLLELSGATSIEEFRRHFLHDIQERIRKDCLERQARWTEAVAVGSEQFVEAMECRLRNRQSALISAEDGAWVLREEHGSLFGVIN
ncbi:MAG: transposase [Verrucomicrobia bacterium]|nr:transposase [Verrucomicrobiota bacterium]